MEQVQRLLERSYPFLSALKSQKRIDKGSYHCVCLNNCDFMIIVGSRWQLDLANLVNMAAVKAAVDGIDKITTNQLEFAKDKLLMGTERKSMSLTEESRKVIYRALPNSLSCQSLNNLVKFILARRHRDFDFSSIIYLK